MSAQDVLVRAQELSGQWVNIGTGKGRGIVVEDLTMDADAYGPRASSFTLKRNPQAIWPDISAFTPVEVEVGGIVCWEGRVKESPTKDGADRQMSVSCEGWQFHLDDDVYQRTYAHTSLGDWFDQRSVVQCQLANFVAAGQVSPSGSAVVFAYPAGTYPAGASVGITLDFGQSLCQRIGAINYTTSNNAAINVDCVGTDNPNALDAGGELAFVFLNNAAASGSRSFTFTTPRRYVHFFMNWTAGGTLASDVWVSMNLARLFSSTAYESGSSSILKASDVVIDARSRATLLLSSDVSKVQATTFSIPDFDMSVLATPREAIMAVNAYHNYQVRVTRNRLLEFRPQPAGPVYTAADSGGIEFDDASANSGLDIYSGVNVTYTGPDGVSNTVSRSQPSTNYVPSLIQPTNPSALVDTSSWTHPGGTGTFVRTTTAGEFSTAPGGFKVGSAVPFSQDVVQTSAWTGGAFIPGQSYRLTLDVRTSDTPFELTSFNEGLKIMVDGVFVGSAVWTHDGTFHSCSVDWIHPSTSTPIFQMRFYNWTGAQIYWDNLQLFEANPTLVSRRQFRRTKVLDTNMALTTPAAQQIGDTYLTGHKTTPFKGSISVNGNAAIRRVQGGVTVPPHELLFNTGDLVRLPHLIDPDTGGLGRDGRIATVTCNPIQGTGSIELDNTRNNLDALLARLSTVVGQIPNGQ